MALKLKINKNNTVIRILPYVVALCVAIGLMIWGYNKLFIFADEQSATMEGMIYGAEYGLTGNQSPLAGARIYVYRGDGSLVGSSTSGKSGYFATNIPKPLDCLYKVIVSAPNYNTVRQYWSLQDDYVYNSYNSNGGSGVSLIGNTSSSYSPNFTSPNSSLSNKLQSPILFGGGKRIANYKKFVLNKEIDAMYSNYFGSSYFNGYENSYRVSHHDKSIIRNLISEDKYISSNGQSDKKPNGFLINTLPDSAKIELTVERNFVTYLPYNVRIKACPIISDWESNVSKTAGTISSSNCGYFTMDLGNNYKGKKIKINVPFDGMKDKDKFYSYVNGFSLSMIDLMPIDKQANIHVDFTRSENNMPATIEYGTSNQANYFDAPEDKLRGCIVSIAQKYAKYYDNAVTNCNVPFYRSKDIWNGCIYKNTFPYCYGGSSQLDSENEPEYPNPLPDRNPNSSPSQMCYDYSKGVDCSSFVNLAYSYARLYSNGGGHGPETGEQNNSLFKKISDPRDALPGDVIFLGWESSGRPGHIVLVTKNNNGKSLEVVEAAGWAYGVVRNSIDIVKDESTNKYVLKKFNLHKKGDSQPIYVSRYEYFDMNAKLTNTNYYST